MRSKIVDIKDANDFFAWVRHASTMVYCDGCTRWLFRGQAGHLWSFYSSLTRMTLHEETLLNPLFLGRDERKMLRAEHQWINYARQFVDAGMSTLQLMCEMQHSGIPTRLLDVSLSPFVALFMALWGQTENMRSDPVSVHSVRYISGEADFDYDVARSTKEFELIMQRDLDGLTKSDLNHKLFCVKAPVAFDRVVSQNGMFLTVGRLIDIEQAECLKRFGTLDFSGMLDPMPISGLCETNNDNIGQIRFDFHPCIHDLAIEFLRSANITEITMFPRFRRVSQIPMIRDGKIIHKFRDA